MADKLQKLAQMAEDVALVDKNPAPQYDELELISKAQQLIDSYHSMNLPPQSMSVFMPFGHALDELKRVRELPELDREEMHQRFEGFLSHYGKVLHYLQEQGHDVAADLDMVKQYADMYFQGVPGASSRAAAARKVLTLASKLQAEGETDIANRLLRSIATTQPWEEEYRTLLSTENYDGARELYLGLDPIDRKNADEIGRVYHSANTLLNLQRIGQSLFDKERYVEAHKIDRMIKAQFVELPEDMQQQVILVILPEGLEDQLPQAFKATEDAEKNTKMMEERMTNMKDRLMPDDACGGCGTCGETVSKLLSLADRLDEQGLTEIADKVDSWLQKTAYPGGVQELIDMAEDLPITPTRPVKQQPVNRGECPGCGTEVYYRGASGSPAYCSHCKKDPFGTNAGLKTAKDKDKKDKVKDKKDGKPAKVKEIADAIRRDNKDISDEVAYRMAWETYCSYTNKSYPQCTEKGKSKRKSPKPYEKSSSIKEAAYKCKNCGGEVGDFEHSDLCDMCHKEGDDNFEKEATKQYRSRQEKEEAEKGEWQPSRQFPHAHQYPTKPRYQQTDEEKEEMKRRKFDKELEEARNRRS